MNRRIFSFNFEDPPVTALLTPLISAAGLKNRLTTKGVISRTMPVNVQNIAP